MTRLSHQKVAAALLYLLAGILLFAALNSFVGCAVRSEDRPAWSVGLSADQVGNQEFKATIGGSF